MQKFVSKNDGKGNLKKSGIRSDIWETAAVIAQRGVLSDGVNFIQKPFSIRALTTAVRKVLDA